MIRLDFDFEEQLRELDKTFGDMAELVSESMEEVATLATTPIEETQRQMLSAAGYGRLARLIGKRVRLVGVGTVRVDVGYDSKTIEENPEAYVLEFGRPGISKRTRQRRPDPSVDKNGRKIGVVQAVPAIRASWLQKREEAADLFLDNMMEIARGRWEE